MADPKDTSQQQHRHTEQQPHRQAEAATAAKHRRVVFKQPGTDSAKALGRDIALDMDKAEAVTHVGGDDYLVTISGVNHRIREPKTNAGHLMGTRTLSPGADTVSDPDED